MRSSLLCVVAVAATVTATKLAAQASELPCASYATFERHGSTTELIGLAVGDVPAGSKVTISCWGSNCPFGSHSMNMKSDTKTLGLTDMFPDPNLKAGSVIQIQITKPGWVGKSFKYEIMSSSDPRRTTECLAADGSKTVACKLKEGSSR